MDQDALIRGLVYYVVFLSSAIVHEAAHALVALWLGDRTAYEGGQVSLDPIPHFRREPFGMILVPVITVMIQGWPFGWASAPYNPHWERRFPRRSALMALAGPVSNILLMLISVALLQILGRMGLLYDEALGGMGKGLRMFLGFYFFMNTVLALLNLFPLPPLDGSSVIMLFMPDRVARKYLDVVRHSNYAMLGLVVVIVFFWRVFEPVFLYIAPILLHGVEPSVKF